MNFLKMCNGFHCLNFKARQEMMPSIEIFALWAPKNPFKGKILQYLKITRNFLVFYAFFKKN